MAIGEGGVYQPGVYQWPYGWVLEEELSAYNQKPHLHGFGRNDTVLWGVLGALSTLSLNIFVTLSQWLHPSESQIPYL